MELQIPSSMLAGALASELRAVEEASRAATVSAANARDTLPPSVDYSPYVRYIRHQGIPGWGCFAYSMAACWDIQNQRMCPDSPNVSVNRMLWMHAMRRPVLVGEAMEEDFRKSGATSAANAVADWFAKQVDFAGPGGQPFKNSDDYLTSVGIATEGTEWTDPDGVRWPTAEGDREAPSFRLKSKTAVPVDLDELRRALVQGPVRIEVWHRHFVALVGYDDALQRFKYLDSAGDRNGENGFGYIAYNRLAEEVQGGEFYEFVPPQSVPTATITLHHVFRQDVYLWLRVEGCPSAGRIWPNSHREDDSRNLCFTVMLPRGFAWPPGPGNRIFLDVYDCGEHSPSGGSIDVYVSFCGQKYVRDHPPHEVPGHVTAGATFPTRELFSLHVP